MTTHNTLLQAKLEIIGTEGDDTLYGTAGDDTIRGLGGNDFIRVFEGRNFAYGDGGDDFLEGGGGLDALYGGAGDDQLSGGNGNDRLWGGTGDDMLDGGGMSDVMYGGWGHDTFIVDHYDDIVVETNDSDYDAVYSSVDYVLPDRVELLLLWEGATYGGGNELANNINGNAASNLLEGFGGDDCLQPPRIGAAERV